MQQDWRVGWSHQLEGKVCAIAADAAGMIVAAGGVIRMLDTEGEFVWRREVAFDVYHLEIDLHTVAVLAGPGFHLLDIATGEPLGEGRSVSGGFRSVIARPGGGWVLQDRGDHMHLFDRNGRGIRRLRPGRIRYLVGWLDREHLLVHDDDGYLRCLRLSGDDSQRVIEGRRWAWVSRLSGGRLLVQSPEGSLYEGTPNPFGWDSLEQLRELAADPLAADRCGDGWWVLTLSETLEQVPPTSGGEMPAGHLLSSNGADVMCTATRDGLVRWWESPQLASRRSEILKRLVVSERRRIDWEQRQVMFEAALAAEDEGMLTNAIELYQALGRTEDVRRLLGQQEQASAGG